MKPWYVSKTVWVNVVATAVSLYSLFQVTTVFPADALPWFGLAVGILNIILRVWFTDTSIG